MSKSGSSQNKIGDIPDLQAELKNTNPIVKKHICRITSKKEKLKFQAFDLTEENSQLKAQIGRMRLKHQKQILDLTEQLEECRSNQVKIQFDEQDKKLCGE